MYCFKKRKLLLLQLIAWLGLVAGCTGVPDGIEPVSGFDSQRYLGTWYEIARLDHRFERGLDAVTADYAQRDDGGIDVVNRGYDTRSGEWREARGKAYFVGDSDTGHLKVSFFGPFYASYVVFELGTAYEYALVSGNDHSYFWLLSRTPMIPGNELDRLLRKAEAAGFDTTGLILVNHASE